MDEKGYPLISVNGKTRRAHRVIYEREVGPIPDGYTIDHECHNEAVQAGTCSGGVCEHRRCLNPDHLVARSRTDNHVRGWRNANAKRTHCAHGHAFTPANTYWHRAAKRDGGKKMYRACRACRRERKRK